MNFSKLTFYLFWASFSSIVRFISSNPNLKEKQTVTQTPNISEEYEPNQISPKMTENNDYIDGTVLKINQSYKGVYGYYVTIISRNPKLNINIKIDTQIPFLWLVDDRCLFCYEAFGMQGAETMSKRKSYSVIKNVVSGDDGSSFYGEYAVDNFIIGKEIRIPFLNVAVPGSITPPKSFSIESEKVYTSFKTSLYTDLSNPIVSGVLGLGHQYENLKKNMFFSQENSIISKLKNKIISIDLRKENERLSLGFIDKNYTKSDFHWVNIPRDSAFEVTLNYIKIKDIVYVMEKKAVLNPRYKETYLPGYLVDNINSDISNWYTFGCYSFDKIDPIEIGINGKGYTIHPQNFLISYFYCCDSKFTSIQDNIQGIDTVILGESFFQEYMVVFDYENNRIGIAN
ncbi:hypothetical protein BB559_006849 [Furculomyces boomerangus]|uniref:Peptidase A1 domain-containing protein n=1 Tax=Furculomyces boomerangus TaxID=61424 RepID=A0A2T9Y0C4_9FUNG|nr:hypothetical protein BB559_006849 [Furculomyces boomerangus]